jgi:D-2-hydroxyglutarate dehydrogenase
MGNHPHQAAVETLVAAKTELSESLQAFEFLDRASLELVCAQMKGARDPLPGSEAPFYVVMETSGSV